MMYTISMKRIWGFFFVLVCFVLPLLGQDGAASRDKVIVTSKTYLGVPYRYGGQTRSGMDCSGFICTVFQEAVGETLPRQSSSIYSSVMKISDAQRQPGDLVFFSVYGNDRVGHVGIYLGNDEFIHAASDGPKTGVIISKLSENYWRRNYIGAGRVLLAANSTIASASASTDDSSAGASSDFPVTASKPSIASVEASTSGGRVSSQRQSSGGGSGVFRSIFRRFNVDFTAAYDWSFYAPDGFDFISRGFSVDVGFWLDGLLINPGVGVSFFYDDVMGAYQFPFLVTIQPFDIMQVYGGVVLTAGNPKTVTLHGSGTAAMGQVWPGVFGVKFILPAIEVGKVNLHVVQDIRYKAFAYGDGTPFLLQDALSSGVVFSTGIRVTLPFSKVL